MKLEITDACDGIIPINRLLFNENLDRHLLVAKKVLSKSSEAKSSYHGCQRYVHNKITEYDIEIFRIDHIP